MPTMSFLNRETVKQVRRIYRELAEIEPDRLYAHCVRIKSQIGVRLAEAVRASTESAVSLNLLNGGKEREVCRICAELAEMKTDRLCARCVRIKSQISARFAEAVRGAIRLPAQQHCERSCCSCAACDAKTLGPHPLYVFDLARADRREIHFHPRCHELWLEAVNGPKSGPEPVIEAGSRGSDRSGPPIQR
jgi:hypothetical protein